MSKDDNIDKPLKSSSASLRRSVGLKRSADSTMTDDEDDGFLGSDEEFFSDEDQVEEFGHDFDESVGGELTKVGRGELERHIQRFIDLHPFHLAKLELRDKIWVMVLSHRPDIDPLLAKSYGLSLHLDLVVEIHLQPPKYIEDMKAPKIDIYQSLDASTSPDHIFRSGICWFLKARLYEWVAKNWPPKDVDFLTNMMDHLTARINTCAHSCMICDSPLPTVMLKPTVCDKLLCLHSHEIYGLGVDVANEVKENAEVVELLLSFTKAAAKGGQVKRFNPFPSSVEVEVREQIEEDGLLKEVIVKKSFMHPVSNIPVAETVTKVLEKLPKLSVLQQHNTSSQMRMTLDEYNPLAYPLLRWIITSNRAYLIKLKEHDLVTGLSTKEQYLFVSSPPEKEAKFQELKAQKGSFWAFHGSADFNWHSILRIGLKNYSNTEFMSAGAAYGAGIYMAAQLGTSLGYSARHGSAGHIYMAICEVINAGYVAKPFYVIPKEEHVVTRYFLQWTDYNEAMKATR